MSHSTEVSDPASDQKKWFVYLGDHHEGPFSVSEIQVKVTEGAVSSANYVWAEGMGDWQLMTEVGDFAGVVRDAEQKVASTPTQTEQPASSAAVTTNRQEVELAVSPAPAVVVQVERGLSSNGVDYRAEADQIHNPATVNIDRRPLEQTQTLPPRKAPKSKLKKVWSKTKRPLITAAGVVMVAVLASGGYFNLFLEIPPVRKGVGTIQKFTEPLVQKTVVKYPILTRIISPIPKLEDITREELAELRSAASASLADTGPSLTFAVSRADPLAPVIYVASNLPEGAVLDIYVEGVPDTLLNRTSVTVQTAAVVSRRFGRSPAVRMNDGKPIPRGEYNIYVTESQMQPDEAKALLAAVPQLISPDAPKWLPSLKLLARRSYFLGGPKDQTYAARLKEFHDKLREKANSELAEIKQFSSTLESQLNETVSQFTRLGGGRNPAARRREWVAFRDRWSRMQAQLDLVFQKWTPDVVKNEFFYGRLYEMIQQTGSMVRRLHSVQDEVFVGRPGVEKPDLNALQIQLAEATNVAQSTVVALKAKIDMVEKQPSTANGMPNREGL